MKIARLGVELTPVETVRLPRYKGAVIRGGFGLAFRRVSCPFPKRECADCLLRQQCVWSYVFNTPRPDNAEVMRKYETVPHPFVIEPPEDEETQFGQDDRLTFTLVLIGRAIDHIPYFIYAFEQMAEQGLGPGRGRLAVAAVRQGEAKLYDGKAKSITAPLRTETLGFRLGRTQRSAVTVRFLTPTRIIYQGKMTRRPQFHVIVRSLLRRIGLLAYFHDEPVTLDYRSIIAQAEAVEMKDCSLAGCQWNRYSTRQERMVEMEGMTGAATYEGDVGLFLPFLRAGELVHVGKGTTFGMGKYEMEVR